MDQLEQLEACRICVTCYPLQEMDFINIFHKNEEFQQELDFIQGEIRQWQLKIQPDDGLPQRICANCFAKFCSIEAYRKECVLAQERLIETVMQQTSLNTDDVLQNDETNQMKAINNSPLQLLSNYDTVTGVTLGSGANVLVSSVNLTQSDVSLNDFPVFDQQFAQYDNPALIDASSTLLDSSIIAPESAQELGFLPSQNLFTFETAEPPSTGTLPLVETDTTSIMTDILDVRNDNNDVNNGQQSLIKQDDLEDMLKHSIIPTIAKLGQHQSQPQQQRTTKTNSGQQENQKVSTTPNIKKDVGHGFLSNNNNVLKAGRIDYQSAPMLTFLTREDTNSDIECDDSDMNVRLKGLSYACHYCFCPETGPIDHLVFPNEDALSQHFFDIHDPNRPYTCPKCPHSYKTQLLRDNHVRLIHKITEIQTCNYCQKRLKGSIDVHQYNCQYIGDWECQQCKEKFLNTPLYRFRLHQRQHERTKQFKCRLCERTFMRKANLEAHQRMHKTEVQTAHTCNLCPASFADDYELKRHKYQQHNGEPPAKCKICHKGFSSNVFLQRHMTQLHADNLKHGNNNNNKNPSSSSSTSSAQSTEPQHTCLNCSVSFKSLQRLQNHLLLGRDKNGNCLYNSCNKQERRKLQRAGVFPCFHCPRRFHLRSQLDKHLNTHDARLRPFQCQQCVTRCRTTFELKQHVNVAHLNIKAFACDKCGKCFGYKKDLRDHMLFHSEINVHCREDGCDYVCKNEKALNDHIRHKHRLLSCEYCHEQFTRQKLTSHLRNVHRSEIDVELAGESDNYYKSQLLNNNNDITQISFNLLNTQHETQQQTHQLIDNSLTTIATATTTVALQQEQLLTTSSTTTPTLLTTLSPSSTSSSSSSSVTLNANIINNAKHLNALDSALDTTPISTVTTLTCSLINNNSNSNNSNNLSTTNCCTSITNTNSLNNNSHDDHNDHHQQLCDIFATDDPHNTNVTTLALNGLVSNEHDDINLNANDTANIFLVPTTATSSSATNDSQQHHQHHHHHQLDQYFMASLIDTEQEIIVT